MRFVPTDDPPTHPNGKGQVFGSLACEHDQLAQLESTVGGRVRFRTPNATGPAFGHGLLQHFSTLLPQLGLPISGKLGRLRPANVKRSGRREAKDLVKSGRVAGQKVK